ncbi:MAG: tRNA epoxyqueuosine(34) reductase QueG [Pyrinomonadaceae bacterium]|nr:tRNA epoxyqueuosine(34) reductase QueG [Pyrinomonadaceae bacterium]
MVSLTNKIKQKALEIGFHKVGIAPAEALTHEYEHLIQWINSNYHAEMQWMEREPEKRANPKLLFPGAKSVIAVALNYYTPHQHDSDKNKGKISRYAWGDDYHDVLQGKLRELLSWIKSEIPKADGKVCCDIQPIMDKAWAVRAGLGWIGKHTNLITKDLGSWVFLGEILLNVELEYDNFIEPDHCGNCTACLDACPTNAIIEPYLVDSKRCLSYATIELRAPKLPDEIVNDLDSWLYGCDVCQDICPWNRFQKETDEQRFEPRKDNISRNLQEVLSLSHEEYVQIFRGSAMKRAKLSGLQRNAEALLESKSEKNKKDAFEK